MNAQDPIQHRITVVHRPSDALSAIAQAVALDQRMKMALDVCESDNTEAGRLLALAKQDAEKKQANAHQRTEK